MLTLYDDDGDVSLTLDIQSLPTGWRVVWHLYSAPRAFSRHERGFPSREEARAFVQGFLQTAPVGMSPQTWADGS